MENKNQLPEAPVSLTFKISYKGIEVLATKRDLDAQIKPYLESAKIAIDWALTNGFEVPVRPSFNKQPVPKDYVEGRVCPVDGAKLIKATTKDGRKLIKCENNKWDFQLKKATGCTFTEWVNDTASPEVPERQVKEDIDW